MNLYGWSLQAFRNVLGSNNNAVLQAATAHLSESLKEESALARGKAWLRTLIEAGFPLREDREPQSVPADGGLLTVQMETEAHAIVVYCIARAIRHDDFLDLSGESSHWAHPAVGTVYRELAQCGFTKSKQCPREYFGWMSNLSNGSPLFGDDFRTHWSYYSIFTNQELAAIIPVLQAAAEFQKSVPEGYPEEITKNLQLSLSDTGKEFVGDLITWFSQIQHAGQDAFILWW
jgi:hypothetical protein